MDNVQKLGFKGDMEVKYAEVVLGEKGMTVIARLIGGSDARIEKKFMYFCEKNPNYPIRVVRDSITGVAYRTGPKWWMDSMVMLKYLREPLVLNDLCNVLRLLLFVDNFSAHNQISEFEDADGLIKNLYP